MPGAIAALTWKAIATAFLKALAYAALNILVSKIVKGMQKKPTQYTQKVDVNYSGSLEPRRKLYGYYRAGGLEVIPAVVSGYTGGRLHKCLAMSDGETESVDAVWFNNERYSGHGVDYSDATGHWLAPPLMGYAFVNWKLGTSPQSFMEAMAQCPGWSVTGAPVVLVDESSGSVRP